ncbi:MAG TPA: glycosyltransferase [Polyangiaceae bacterium]|nr:glycosyltransferase [Polyangiaceae bacterium]
MASITLCMIVRDEEAMLGDCLASVRASVDDVVVVDTGSRDATKRIAADAGARVFELCWRDDFAAARNEALKHARGEWVLVLDADERLAPDGGGHLRAAVGRAKFDCGMLRLHDARRLDAPIAEVVSGRERQAEVQLVPRLLRRTDGLAYVDAIHENVMPWLRRRGMKVAGVDADIVHLGAVAEVVRAKSKIDRNVRLLRARVDREPGDLSASGYLAHDLMRMGALDDAFSLVERAWAHVPRVRSAQGPPAIHRLATTRSFLLIRKGRFAEARETVRVARWLEGDSPDLVFLAANAFELEAQSTSDPAMRREKLTAARDGYRECLGFGGRVFAQSFIVGASSWYGATRLGTVELALDRPSEALRAFDVALGVRACEREPRLGRAEAMIKLGDAAAALQNIEGLLDDSSPDSWTLAAAAVSLLGLADDARLFARRALDLADKGFAAPHRRRRLHELMSSATTKQPRSHSSQS